MKNKISVLGIGYLGTIYSLGFASFDYKVNAIDINKNKIERLRQGQITIYEEGLEELFNKTRDNIEFTTDLKKIKESKYIFICVGTPETSNGEANLDYLFQAINSIKEFLNENKILIIKSTIPVGTTKRISQILEKTNCKIIFSPEFLSEGSLIKDFFNPQRIIFGLKNKEEYIKKELLDLYSYFVNKNIPILFTNWETAELIKYASNAFLATKISFINEIVRFADVVNANIKDISYALGLDKRINPYFLNAGIGYGGSCFPKDINSLINQFKQKGIEPLIIKSVQEVNQTQTQFFLNKIKKELNGLNNKKIAIIGLSFKPNTDDIRESKSIELMRFLLKENAKINAFDYIENTREKVKETLKEYINNQLNIHNDLFESIKYVDAIIIGNECTRINNEDWFTISNLVKNKLIFDTKNILNKEKLRSLGFKHIGIGY